MSENFVIVPENEGKPTTCSFSEGRLTACWPLEDALEFPHGRGIKHQGLKLVSLVNMKTHKFSRNAVSLISGEYKRGVELSFCPFCASILQPDLAEEVTVTVAAREADLS